jgi:hypothetical protein
LRPIFPGKPAGYFADIVDPFQGEGIRSWQKSKGQSWNGQWHEMISDPRRHTFHK